jgi:hypothetical protein
MKKNHLLEIFEKVNGIKLSEDCLLSENYLLESRIDFLKDRYVGKLVDNDEFNTILSIDPSPKKLYTQWLLNVYNKDYMQKGKNIKDLLSDKNSIDDKLNFFDSNKSVFSEKDINKYSLPELNSAIDKIKTELNIGTNNNIDMLTPVEIDKLKKVGIRYLGVYDGYQAFKIPKGNDSQQTHKVYSNLICQGKTHICTASNYSRFMYYLTNDDLFILINSSDELSPYHISKFSNQISDKNDKITDNKLIINIANKLK